MRITAIKCFPLSIGHRNQFVIKVETDEGIYGLGEGGVLGREMAMQGTLDHYRRFLIGMDPRPYRAHLAGALSQPVFRRWKDLRHGDLGN